MSEGNLRADQLMVPLSGKVGTGDFNFLYSLVAELDDVRAKRIVDLVLKYNRHVPPVAASAGSEERKQFGVSPDGLHPHGECNDCHKDTGGYSMTYCEVCSLRHDIQHLRNELALALSGSEATALSSLRWAMGYINDDASNGIPPHDCEFIENPEKGACDFHEQWVMAMQAAGLEIEPEDAATQGSRAPQEGGKR